MHNEPNRKKKQSKTLRCNQIAYKDESDVILECIGIEFFVYDDRHRHGFLFEAALNR